MLGSQLCSMGKRPPGLKRRSSRLSSTPSMTYSLYNELLIPEDSQNVRNIVRRNTIPILPKLPPFRLLSLQLRNPGFDQRHDFLILRLPCLFEHPFNREHKYRPFKKQLKLIASSKTRRPTTAPLSIIVPMISRGRENSGK